MSRLIDLIPDADTLVAMAPEELASYVLHAVRDIIARPFMGGMCGLQTLLNELPVPLSGQGPGYEQRRISEIEATVAEAWAWLESERYLVPASGINGENGHRILGRRAEALTDVKAIRAASSFPKELLHKAITNRVHSAILRGDHDTAIILALRAVEESVRAAASYTNSDVGVPMMRKAFQPGGGPLADPALTATEQQAISDLFAGAMGAYRNPHTHRTIPVCADATQEIVMLASHLLRIVDARPKP
jgi:uncharacterized protein (TIGR02391 family)